MYRASQYSNHKNMAAKRNTTRNLLLISGVVIVLLVVFLWIFKDRNTEEGKEIELANVERRDITQVVTASGKIQPEVEVKISPDVSGEIVFLAVKEGDWVEKGMLLARIKSDFYAAQVEQSEAGVSQAKAALAQSQAQLMGAELDFNRQKDLFEKGVIPKSTFEAAQTQFNIAKANTDAAKFAVQSAEARLREAREQLNKTSIFAPMSGVVSQLNVELGERVVGTSQMSGTEMMRIARLDQMEVQVDVNENDVVNVAVGDTANVSVDAYPERVFKGVVTEIANSARTTGTGTQDQVTNFPVKVRLVGQAPITKEGVQRRLNPIPSPEETPVQVTQAEFRPGMSGTVDISTDTIINAVAVPIQAVTVRDYAKPKGKQAKGSTKTEEETPTDAANPNPVKKKEDLRKVVFVIRDGKAHMVQVETGIANETHIEIKSGLSGTEKVIIGPYSIVSRELEEGEAVRTRKTDNKKN